MFAQINLGGLVYTVDSLGQVYKRRGHGLIKCFPDKDGYLKVSISLKIEGVRSTYNEPLHRVIYRAFKGEIPDGLTIDHIDDDKSNNALDNLQLMTAEENAIKGNARNWVVRHPDGSEEKVYNLTGWCRDRGFHKAHLHSIAKGTSKCKSYRGMTCYEST